MNASTSRRGFFWIGFLLVTLIVAGGISYLASSDPDGLDSATLQGCEIVDNAGAEELTGSCIAQHAQDHAMAGSPLADYTIAGDEATSGLAGVIGVAVTLLVAGAAFWLIARTRTKSATEG